METKRVSSEFRVDSNDSFVGLSHDYLYDMVSNVLREPTLEGAVSLIKKVYEKGHEDGSKLLFQ